MESEIREVLSRPKFHGLFDLARQELILGLLMPEALLVDPTERVTDCRDVKDNKYLELALAAACSTSIPGAGFAS